MGENGDAVCRLIIGLGNPGEEYQGTRHNAGFEVIDRFLMRGSKAFSPRKTHAGLAWEGRFASRNVLLLKPQTFMNLSGEAVGPLMRGEKLSPAEILVVYDDIDLPVGRMRMRNGGGPAGHNGMKSVIGAVGTEAFPRLRIGIGSADPHAKRRADYVLTPFSGEELEAWNKTLDKAAEALEMVLRRGLGTAMNLFNAADFTPETERKKLEKSNTPQQEVGLEKV